MMQNEEVIDRQMLPEPISSYIRSEKVRIVEMGGSVMLSPVFIFDPTKPKPNVDELCGICDSRLSSFDFIADKAREKEMEN